MSVKKVDREIVLAAMLTNQAQKRLQRVRITFVSIWCIVDVWKPVVRLGGHEAVDEVFVPHGVAAECFSSLGWVAYKDVECDRA